MADQVKALLFDVFGTVVDWRNTITTRLSDAAFAAISQHESEIKPNVREYASRMEREDWLPFADAWRQSYYEFTRAISTNPPSIPYKTIDQHFFDSLQKLVSEWELDSLWNEQELRHLSTEWHRLDPWPDSVQGLHLLNQCFTTCTLSNGSVALLKDIAEYANLPWTHVLSSEMFKTYKPNPKVYLGAAERLSLQPGQCAMVAAHLGDLRAAKDNGLFTVYVDRPHEEQWSADKVRQARQDGWVDVWIDHSDQASSEGKGGFVELAEKLDA